MSKLKWNVIVKTSLGEIVNFNIFEHTAFVTDLARINKKYKEDKDFLEIALSTIDYYFSPHRREFRFYAIPHTPHLSDEEYNRITNYVSKGNHIEDFQSRDINIPGCTQITAYAQITENWEAFSFYLIKHRKDLK
jgi:hypothetical protein